MRIRAVALTVLFMISLASPLVSSDTVTTGDTDISGNYTMTGNYTVAKGTTLTIKPGSVIDMQSYWMEVEGTLIVNDATIMSSIQSTGIGSHNSGVWDYITITSNGTAHIHNTTISNAKSCLINDGVLYASNITMQDCIIGIENSGTATIVDFEASSIDQEAVRNTGTVSLTNIDFDNMSGGVKSSGDLDLDNGEFSLVGYGLSLSGGNSDVDNIDFVSSVGTGISIFSGASGQIDVMTGAATNAITAMDSTGFTISNLDMTGSRLINTWSAGNLTIDGAVFVSDSSETPIDIITSGHVTLSGIDLTGSFNSPQGSYDAPWTGIALSGSGDYHISESMIEASDVALVASGTGTVTIDNSTFYSDRLGMEFGSLAGTQISDSTLNMSTGSEKGVDILQGIHNFSAFEINTPFNQFATGTIGLEAWYAEFVSQSVTVNGFATSMSLHDSIAEFNDVSLLDSNSVGLAIYSSSIDINDMFETRISDTGIQMENSVAKVRSWSSSSHENGAVIDNTSRLTSWVTTSSGTLFYDAKGEGQFDYGTSQNLIIDTGIENRIWDVTVSFEDLVGNPIDATWESLGFTGTANSGTAQVPVLESGSEILARFAGVGTVTTEVGADGGTLLMQVPIMPQGDWLLPGGQTIVLGMTDDGSAHTATGNITIPANSHLIVDRSTLEIPSYAKLKVNTLGSFSGVDASVVGSVEIHSEGFSSVEDITSVGTTSLHVEGNVLWTTCQNSILSYNLEITGDVQLDNSCRVTVNSGNVDGNIVVGTGAKFEVVNTLELTVLDKGEAVQGATINIQGQSQSVTTNSEGKATRTASAIVVDSSGTTESYIENITMQWNDITEYITWNPTSSRQHTFTVSTIDGGVIDEYLELERIWSPYYLSSDLVIPSDQTMRIYDGVALRVSDGVTITVEGVMDTGYSTISSTGGGARWGGLIVGHSSDTSLSIVGTNLVEGSPILSVENDAQVTISNALFARSGGAEPLISINSMGMSQVYISSTTLMDSSSNCLEIYSGELSLSNSDIKNCAGDTIWARASWIDINGVEANGDVSLEGVDGGINDLEANTLTISNLDGYIMEELSLSNLVGTFNRDITIDGLNVSGAPGVDLDGTAGQISDLAIDCGGSGIGLISHHGRASSSLVISEGSIVACTKGVDLHTDGETAPLILEDVDISASVAIASDGNPVKVYDGSIIGSVDVSNAQVDLYNVEPSTMTVDNGQIMVWSTHIISASLEGTPIDVDVDITIQDELIQSWETSISGNNIEVDIPYILVKQDAIETYVKATISAQGDALPELIGEYDIGLENPEIISLLMTPNQPPVAEIVVPDEGFRAMETEVIPIRALVSDDLDSNEDLVIEWNVVIGQTSVMKLFDERNNITDLEAGLYVLTLEVTDKQGVSTTDSLSFEITLLDSDGDWTATCNDDYYDKENNLNCGPDIYDTDDDNDGSLDSRDVWPLDPCAYMDTDNDGQPDDLNCPPGVTTWLTVDADDDGDGVPDSLESSNNDEESGSNGVVIIAFVFLFLAAAIILLRRKQVVE